MDFRNAYAQGFAVMAGAAQAHGWPLDFGTIATIWRGGCIIRARFLNRIKQAYDRDPALRNLLLDPWFAGLIGKAQIGLRGVVALATSHGFSGAYAATSHGLCAPARERGVASEAPPFAGGALRGWRRGEGAGSLDLGR